MSRQTRIDVEPRDELWVVRVAGDIDISNAGELSAAIESSIPNGAPGVVVDLSQATYLDSAGVHVLFVLAERMRHRRRQLRLVVPEDAPIRAVLEITGLTRVVPLDPRPPA